MDSILVQRQCCPECDVDSPRPVGRQCYDAAAFTAVLDLYRDWPHVMAAEFDGRFSVRNVIQGEVQAVSTVSSQSQQGALGSIERLRYHGRSDELAIDS
ncbi:hypothetical protein LN996_07345 [Arthrobacter sp. AK01]|uniref:hypothetical protein n=1 Tax=Arthrobacter sp. AK01 TaxID=2894084 RepID=UPI001E39AB55|nr:hypothetical protein [Arthrobacter sp. AK01]MCD4850621.1 hypothetical protein [Arthrobacter sp. AK01]